MGMQGELRTGLIAGHEAQAVRRRWPDEVKARLDADSFAGGAKAGDAARRAGLHPSHLSQWPRQASTLVIVNGFIKPEFLVEIEVIAAAPAQT